MLEATKSWQESGFNVFSGGDLRRMGVSAATVAALGQALSDPAAEVAVYARQYRDDAKGPSASVLSLKDGSGGRIALYQQARTAGSGEAWLAICPATPVGAGGRQDRAGHAALRRVENPQQGLTFDET